MKNKMDCAIVCGYPANNDGTISKILKSRIEKAIDLYKNRLVDYIIVSGGAIHNSYCEAIIMYNYALEKGVDGKIIFIEDKAKSTYHNMMYSKEIMQINNFKDCYIITNSWHMMKARYYAKKFELDFLEAKCQKPEGMSFLKVCLLHLNMPINMFVNRLKGYK